MSQLARRAMRATNTVPVGALDVHAFEIPVKRADLDDYRVTA
jgi:hypothetical protein